MIGDTLQGIFLGIVVLIAVYVIIRVATSAYFESKNDYEKRTMKNQRRGNEHGNR